MWPNWCVSQSVWTNENILCYHWRVYKSGACRIGKVVASCLEIWLVVNLTEWEVCGKPSLAALASVDGLSSPLWVNEFVWDNKRMAVVLSLVTYQKDMLMPTVLLYYYSVAIKEIWNEYNRLI